MLPVTPNPTAEQSTAMAMFEMGESLALQAGAGCGKTSTLVMMAEAAPRRLGQYVAFNRSLVDDAGRRFPSRCGTRTIHSLAMRAKGMPYRHRLDAPRVRSDEIGRMLTLDPFTVRFGSQTKSLSRGYLGSLVMRTMRRFCMSEDHEPSAKHVPYIDGIDVPKDGKRTYTENDKLREHLREPLKEAWRDLSDPTGRLPFFHDVYVKLYEQDDPRIDADYLVVDEAQDLDPVLASIVKQQKCQIALVGDEAQSIYEWRGAINAFDRFDLRTLFLTQSFRFGPAIADVANVILRQLASPLEIVGLPTVPSFVARIPADEVTCILTRTNATAMQTVMGAQLRGRSVYLIGGGNEMQSFIRGVEELQTRGYSTHRDLACFSSFAELCAYVREDPAGDELRLMVDLVQEHGVEALRAALSRMPTREEDADLVVSTAHKAKGREWPTVQLTNDFGASGQELGMSDEEWRLLYVACTRAQLRLDPYSVGPVAELLGGGKATVEERVKGDPLARFRNLEA